MSKVLTPLLMCSPKVLIEHLSQQYTHTRLMAKLLKLLRCLSKIANLLNVLTYLPTLSNLAQSGSAIGSWLSCSMSILDEQVAKGVGVRRKSTAFRRCTVWKPRSGEREIKKGGSEWVGYANGQGHQLQKLNR